MATPQHLKRAAAKRRGIAWAAQRRARDERRAEMERESLGRAENGQSWANYPAIMHGFTERGIPEPDIIPRVNVFTYHAWRAKGRQVRRGERGVAITTWVAVPEKRDSSGTVTHPAGRRPKTATVFHISQTDPPPASAGAARPDARCDDPGAHGPGCQCDGGEPVL